MRMYQIHDLNTADQEAVRNDVNRIVDALRGNEKKKWIARVELMIALSLAFCEGCGDEQPPPGKGQRCQCENDE